jgi:hypothetical protein
MSASDVNAEAIGELQAKVTQLEGNVTFLMGALSSAQETCIRLQGYEMERMQQRIDAGATG